MSVLACEYDSFCFVFYFHYIVLRNVIIICISGTSNIAFNSEDGITKLQSETYYTSKYIDLDFKVDYAGGQSCGEHTSPIFDPASPMFAGAQASATLTLHNVTTSNLVLNGTATKDRYVSRCSSSPEHQ